VPRATLTEDGLVSSDDTAGVLVGHPLAGRLSETGRRLAAATERTRVAREMHDIVGHSLSVIITLADGPRTRIHLALRISGSLLQILVRRSRSGQ
jgi:signal transduction histidine kinase